MTNILIILSFTIFIGIVNGNLSGSPLFINEDVKELISLFETYWSNMPDEIAKDSKQTCKILAECCPGKNYSKALSLMVANFADNPYSAARVVCIGSSIPDHSVDTCAATLELDSSSSLPTKEDTAIAEIYRITEMQYKIQLKNSSNHMAHICNSKEVHAYLCMLNNKYLKSCFAKILQQQFNLNGDQAYQEYINKYKTTINNINQKIHLLKSNSY